MATVSYAAFLFYAACRGRRRQILGHGEPGVDQAGFLIGQWSWLMHCTTIAAWGIRLLRVGSYLKRMGSRSIGFEKPGSTCLVDIDEMRT